MRGVTLSLLLATMAWSPAAHASPAPVPPPYTEGYQPRGVDENGFWREDDESERILAASPIVINDAELTAYVHGLLCRTVGQDRCRSIRTYVLREPTFNASMSPNGTMRVFSGLLLRARSESELAAVLGHEFGHFERRHGLERFKSARSGTDLLAWSTLLTSMAGSHQAYQNHQNLELAVYGNIFRFSRDNEREADLLGLGYLNGSELRPQAASAIWTNLMAEVEASALAKGLKKPNFNRVAFTASHPPQGERAAYLSALADPSASHRNDGAEPYRVALAKWLPVFLQDQIKLNDFGASEYIINSLAANGWTADLWLARGELFRMRGSQRDHVQSATFFQNAIALNPGLAEAHRGLGLSLFKTSKAREGSVALREYLRLKPEASDARMVQTLIDGVSGI